jgi:hypothetical protein
MKMFRSWFFRILWWLTFVAVFAVVIVLVNRDWIVKSLVERQIRAATGMEPEIGGFSFGVFDPKATLGNFKLYSPAEFGGTLFMDVPELHIEYDRSALRRRELHVTLMRMNLRELDVVRNAAGATNLMSVFNRMLPRKSGGGRAVAPINGCKFTGIDLLNLSIGAVKFVDLKDQRRNRLVPIGLQNQIYTNVMSAADFPGLSAQLWLRGGRSVGLPVNPAKPNDSQPPAPKAP